MAVKVEDDRVRKQICKYKSKVRLTRFVIAWFVSPTVFKDNFCKFLLHLATRSQ